MTDNKEELFIAFDSDIADSILENIEGLCPDNVARGVFHLMAVISALCPTYEGASFLLEQVYKFADDFEKMHEDCDEDNCLVEDRVVH